MSPEHRATTGTTLGENVAAANFPLTTWNRGMSTREPGVAYLDSRTGAPITLAEASHHPNRRVSSNAGYWLIQAVG